MHTLTRPAGVSIARLPTAGAKRVAGTAHLVGVCGSGMKALAELLLGSGWRVTGSDAHPSPALIDVFARRGLHIHRGHDNGGLPPDLDVLVYSPAVDAENPERRLARDRGIPQFSYSEMLGRLMRDKVGISVAGTHGKSSTTAMTGCILTTAGLSPSVVLGAEVRGRGANGWAGDGNLFVMESCEYQHSFLDLTPRSAAILNIEPDHFDCFDSFDETVAAFASFARRVPAEGLLVIPADSATPREACRESSAAVETFAVDGPADWWAADLRPVWRGIRFRMFRRGEYFTEVTLQIPGRHNVGNALAAAALCSWNGATARQIRDGLQEFRGIRRRFEIVGAWRGVTLIDDFAHHPTAVQATLRTAREQFPGRRIWCVFQPHQISRTQVLLGEFSESFVAADDVLVAPVYAARERSGPEREELSRELADRIAWHGTRARFCASLDQTVASLDDEVQPGDVLITMGAGDIDQVHHAFTCRLQRHYPPR